jgi:hypothetical protein
MVQLDAEGRTPAQMRDALYEGAPEMAFGRFGLPDRGFAFVRVPSRRAPSAGTELLLQRFDASGRGATPPRTVTATAGVIRDPVVLAAGEGLLALWEEATGASAPSQVYARPLASDGAPRGDARAVTELGFYQGGLAATFAGRDVLALGITGSGVLRPTVLPLAPRRRDARRGGAVADAPGRLAGGARVACRHAAGRARGVHHRPWSVPQPARGRGPHVRAVSPADVAAVFAESLLRLGAAHGMTDATPSPHVNRIYEALAAHLGWFRPRAVDPALRDAIPPVPEGFAVLCEAPEQSVSPGSASAWWDLACGCVVRGPEGAVGLAIASQREGVTLLADGSGLRTRVWAEAVEAPGTPSRTAPWSSLARLLRGARRGGVADPRGVARVGRVARRPTGDRARGGADGLARRRRARGGEHLWRGAVGGASRRRSWRVTPAALAAAVMSARATRALPGEACPRCGDALVDLDLARVTAPAALAARRRDAALVGVGRVPHLHAM